MFPTRIREIDMKKIKITEQIHVLGTTFKDIYEIADYSCKKMPKDGVYVGQLVRHHLWFDECDYLSDNYWWRCFAKHEDLKPKLQRFIK